MPTQVTPTALTALAMWGALATSPPAAATTTTSTSTTTASIASSLSPNRLGAKGSLTFTVRYSGGELGVPSPVRLAILRFPAGLSIDIPRLRSCSATRLRTRGAGSCPARSKLGGGHAIVETRPASQTIFEHVVLKAFLGPPRHLQPTVEILGEGHTPLDARMVLSGSVLIDRAPYGEELVMHIPPIHTLPLEPDASISSLSLTVGARRRRAGAANTIVVPSSCPPGGFPFAAEFTYADGSHSVATTKTPCPR